MSSTNCTECNVLISQDVFMYSTKNFGLPLCYSHQQWVKEVINYTTPETMDLYFALKLRGVPAEIEKYDGFKTIDIAIVEAKMNIEVDGVQHNFNPQQALADLQRTFFSFLKGYLTLRIPNSLVRFHLEETADLITEFLNHKNIRENNGHYTR